MPRLERAFGEAWVGEGEGLALRPPLDMRVNRLKGDRTRTLGALARFGAAATAFSPDGLRIAATEGNGRHPNVQVEPSFQKGWFEVQDEGSQIAALLVGVAPGEQVLDLCAGAGGKTLAMSAAMANKGQIFATDSDRTRLAPIFDRLRRAGARNVQIREAGAPLDDLDRKNGRRPRRCALHRHRRLAPPPRREMAADGQGGGGTGGEQAALLRTAAEFVRPGGRLVYVTCSLLPEENADQVAAFLADDERFAPVSAETALCGLPRSAGRRGAWRRELRAAPWHHADAGEDRDRRLLRQRDAAGRARTRLSR